jgi:hypothetical protein
MRIPRCGWAKRVYGIVGDSLNGLTDAIRRHSKIEWVHLRIGLFIPCLSTPS